MRKKITKLFQLLTAMTIIVLFVWAAMFMLMMDIVYLQYAGITALVLLVVCVAGIAIDPDENICNADDDKSNTQPTIIVCPCAVCPFKEKESADGNTDDNA